MTTSLTNAIHGRKFKSIDNYSHECFYFSWQSGDEKLLNKNLPKDKQFLVTKGVPCEKRIAELKKFEEEHGEELEREVEDGWVETLNPQKKNNNQEQMIDIDNLDG